MQLSLSESDSTSTSLNNTNTGATGAVVRYRVGLNPVQEACRAFVANMDDGDVAAFTEAFRKEFPTLEPVYPKNMTDTLLAGLGEAYFTPNDLVEHVGLHPDTVDKYLHNYIGVLANSPDYKRERMNVAHPDAPWGQDYAKHLTEPLPLRLVSARALAFIVMAPVSVYRPTTNDTEIVERWERLVKFRAEAPLRFGIPKGSPKRLDGAVETTTSVRRRPHTKTTKTEDTTPMPIPTLFSLPLPTAPEVDEAIRELCEDAHTLPALIAEVEGLRAAVAPESHITEMIEVAAPVAKSDVGHPSLTDGAILDAYFAAIEDLRLRAERLRGLLDLLPAQEVNDRVAEFFRAGLNVLDKGRMA